MVISTGGAIDKAGRDLLAEICGYVRDPIHPWSETFRDYYAALRMVGLTSHIHRTRQTQLAIGSRPRNANRPDVVENMVERTLRQLRAGGLQPTPGPLPGFRQHTDGADEDYEPLFGPPEGEEGYYTNDASNIQRATLHPE